ACGVASPGGVVDSCPLQKSPSSQVAPSGLIVQPRSQQLLPRPSSPSSHCSPVSTTPSPHGLRLPTSVVGPVRLQAHAKLWHPGGVYANVPGATNVSPDGASWPCRTAPQSFGLTIGKTSVNAPVAESIVPEA